MDVCTVTDRAQCWSPDATAILEGKGGFMTADVKRALAWGFGLGVGFAVAGMALGVFRKVR
jgi:hypothetical protein